MTAVFKDTDVIIGDDEVVIVLAVRLSFIAVTVEEVDVGGSLKTLIWSIS